MNIPADREVIELAQKILADAGKGYTPYQLGEIPKILDTKHKYWWCVDMMFEDLLAECFAEPFNYYANGKKVADVKTPKEQAAKAHRVCNETMVPIHMGHNPIVHFIDDTHAQLLTRLEDYHTYNDDGSTYNGWAMYVDDMVKCNDGVWRIQTLRLTYRKILGGLRTTG